MAGNLIGNLKYRSGLGLFLAIVSVFQPQSVVSGELKQAREIDPGEAFPEEGLEVIFEELLQRSYLRATEDASEAEESEVDDRLWAITPENSDLIWLDERSSQVLMVTWTNWDGYEEFVGLPLELDRLVWVTPAPQVQRFCQNLNLDLNFDLPALTLRLEQYLGLPPDNGKTKFVEFWVDPEDLFRPCPDAEIDDRSCQRQFPESADLEHRRWIVEMMLSSYGVDGYPWTRLGYTYDWGNSQTEVGASEFTIASGSQVTVRSVQTTEEFCQGRISPRPTDLRESGERP
ncbi:MAG: hypothetical protein SWY16_04950 [Cyanobacteriota bacterium]|nr:hypothetical protein [Cyanobacteriota bacterium]